MTDEFSRADYYRILQVDPGAHPEIVRAAYRTLLRVLGKHPDLGGQHGEATSITEAYRTLSDGRRRVAYDQWLRAHSQRPVHADLGLARGPWPAPAPRQTEPLPPGVLNWIRDTLGDFRLAPRVRFARSFDVVFERPSILAPRLYVRAVASLVRADWPGLFVLGQALRVARQGRRPSVDALLVVARYAEEPETFITEARRHVAPWAWHRTAIALCTLSPPRLRCSATFIAPRMLRRLRASLVHGAGTAAR
jgi:hypothetical protein